ncbi:MAG: 4-alpha-glucanotransferase [Deltaproteobacteria bacterium]|nr:4-alpha-glucanotransferase [Deltaproteobacteria bacterium]NCP03858.1 4-alpha-glucanotransferase [Deltaproteobacteria bacterium]
MLTHRQAGVLLHPTSLPGPEGLGTLGDEAFTFIEHLAAAGQSVWQLLPLGPTGYGDCPYSAFSAFAGNPDLISLNRLAEVGDLKRSDLPPHQAAEKRVNFDQCRRLRTPLLRRAAKNFFLATPPRRQAFDQFCQQHAAWLNDYAFYRAMRTDQQHKSWCDWPAALRDRHQAALHEHGTRLAAEIGIEKYLQFVFFEQWLALKAHANHRGVEIIGDLPIFVAYDSADVWANRSLFQLDAGGARRLLAGVPPDYYSTSGQLWGNPLYNWELMAADGYAWWKARLGWNLQQFDLLRIDHFRGFVACWAVPPHEETAINGHWQAGPGADFFSRISQDFPQLPLIAEDLGVITPEVENLRDHFSFPGMKILQFAFDSDARNPYLPHQHPRNALVFTGTHDNATSLAWWQALDGAGKQRVRDYLNSPCRQMPWPLIRAALASSARLAIIPMQDLLSLGNEARMNLPGVADGNWNWRMLPEQLASLTSDAGPRLHHLCELYDRLPGKI